MFAQLINAEGRLLGQHDGMPAKGERPPTGWPPGEVLADRHAMPIKDHSHRRSTRIAIRLNDAVTMKRVFPGGGADHLMIPSEIVVEGKWLAPTSPPLDIKNALPPYCCSRVTEVSSIMRS